MTKRVYNGADYVAFDPYTFLRWSNFGPVTLERVGFAVCDYLNLPRVSVTRDWPRVSKGNRLVRAYCPAPDVEGMMRWLLASKV